MSRMIACALALCIALQCGGRAAVWDALSRGGQLRALLVSCDFFVSQQNTYPSGQHNVAMMRDLLETDRRGYRSIVTPQAIGSAAELENAIQMAFAGAAPQDVCLVYICTHGLFNWDTQRSCLLLSDGEQEEPLYGPQLREMLDAVAGHKVLILDACDSGGFIGKGALFEMENAFEGEAYTVLTASGAAEQAYLWLDEKQGSGGGYFTQELYYGLRNMTFDTNADGSVTLQEAWHCLRDAVGVSSAQCYPQESSMVLYRSDSPAELQRPVSALELQSDAVIGERDALSFSYVLTRPVYMQYQIIYFRDGRWLFDQPQRIYDPGEDGGILLPGLKERTLALSTQETDVYGYLLLQLVVREGRNTAVMGSRLVAVQPEEGDAQLLIRCPRQVRFTMGKELPVTVRTAYPCILTVQIRDEAGKLVRTLAHRACTRPTGEADLYGSVFYWGGKNNAGGMVPPGEYTVLVRCLAGDRVYTAQASVQVETE